MFSFESFQMPKKIQEADKTEIKPKKSNLLQKMALYSKGLSLKSNSPLLWIIVSIVAVVVIAIVAFIMYKTLHK